MASYELRAGSVYLIPSRVLFSCCNRQPMKQLYAHFDVLGVPPRALRAIFDGPLCLSPSELLEGECEELAHELRRHKTLDEARRCRVKALVYRSLAHCWEQAPPEKVEQYRRSDAAHAPVRLALEAIQNNLGQPLSNAHLAQLCGYSEDHFIRCFAECVGSTPARYVQEQRVTAAAQQLLFSAAPIEAIAQSTGFANRFYFSRVFKQHTGLSPAEYRGHSRGAQAPVP